MEFTFELDKTITDKINFLDEILHELEAVEIQENPDFIINSKSASTFYLQIQIKSSQKNTVPIHIFLEGSSLRIDIDGIPEAFEWTNKDIEKPKGYVVSFIKQLLTSYVLLEYYGSHTIMCFFDNKGQLIYETTLRYYNLLPSFFIRFLSRTCEKKLFLPIYPQ